MTQLKMKVYDQNGKTLIEKDCETFPFYIGRAEECQLKIEDVGISRIHAVIEKRGTQLILSDQQSRNGLIGEDGKKFSTLEIHRSLRFQIGPFSIEILVDGVASSSPIKSNTFRPLTSHELGRGPVIDNSTFVDSVIKFLSLKKISLCLLVLQAGLSWNLRNEPLFAMTFLLVLLGAFFCTVGTFVGIRFIRGSENHNYSFWSVYLCYVSYLALSNVLFEHGKSAQLFWPEGTQLGNLYELMGWTLFIIYFLFNLRWIFSARTITACLIGLIWIASLAHYRGNQFQPRWENVLEQAQLMSFPQRVPAERIVPLSQWMGEMKKSFQVLQKAELEYLEKNKLQKGGR